MNSVYAWGSNKHRQISPKPELHVYSPTCYQAFEHLSPSQIAAGDAHSLVLTDYGDLYSFGRGRQGELGHPDRRDCTEPKIVEGLGKEVCVEVACGSVASYAVTASGKVYHWGLILAEGKQNNNNNNNNNNEIVEENGAEDDDEDINNDTAVAVAAMHEENTTMEEPEDHAAASGQLTGLAQDQNTFYVQADTEARSGSSQPYAQSRQLRDIVKDSTERWMLANDGADEEYLREMKALGYQNEEVQQMMEQRDKEYHGMLRLGCRRIVQTVPALIRSLNNVKVMKVAAGYAHCMVITDNGHMYASGYNDRGQLGLGHRISTSEFKWVDYLAGKFVTQVVCGQQHTLCRAIDRQHAPSDIYVGSKIGCDVYSWGNGMLGQLGLGRRGTSKGRLLPTLIPSLHEQFYNQIVEVAAGHMFSVAVNREGMVFSWGHAEYNQHGTGGSANKDYTDPYHFFIPRQVPILKGNSLSNPHLPIKVNSNNKQTQAEYAHMVSISCGSNYSVGVDEDGNAYSWGWNESGVLGHGIGYFSSAPMKIAAIGMSTKQYGESKPVVLVGTGNKHVLALTTISGFKSVNHLRQLLDHPQYIDARLVVDDVVGVNTNSTRSFPCHRVVLAARCPYFLGFLKMDENEQIDIRNSQVSLKKSFIDTDNDNNFDFDDNNNNNNSHHHVVEIDLTGYSFANAITIASLLEYIYLDKIVIIEHKKTQLLELAKFLCITPLVDILQQQLEDAKKWNSGSNDNMSSKVNDTGAVASTASSFAQDMQRVFPSELFVDVAFVFRGKVKFFAHKAVLTQINYFEGMLHSNFKESNSLLLTSSTSATTTTLGKDLSSMLKIDLEPFLEDEITPFTVKMMLQFAYSGTVDLQQSNDDEEGGGENGTDDNVAAASAVSSKEEKDKNEDGLVNEMSSLKISATAATTAVAAAVEEQQADQDDGTLTVTQNIHNAMMLLIAANRFGYSRLSLFCERELTASLKTNAAVAGNVNISNVQYCLSYAKAFHLVRLERQCLDALRLVHG